MRDAIKANDEQKNYSENRERQPAAATATIATISHNAIIIYSKGNRFVRHILVRTCVVYFSRRRLTVAGCYSHCCYTLFVHAALFLCTVNIRCSIQSNGGSGKTQQEESERERY